MQKQNVLLLMKKKNFSLSAQNYKFSENNLRGRKQHLRKRMCLCVCISQQQYSHVFIVDSCVLLSVYMLYLHRSAYSHHKDKYKQYVM